MSTRRAGVSYRVVKTNVELQRGRVREHAESFVVREKAWHGLALQRGRVREHAERSPLSDALEGLLDASTRPRA